MRRASDFSPGFTARYDERDTVQVRKSVSMVFMTVALSNYVISHEKVW